MTPKRFFAGRRQGILNRRCIKEMDLHNVEVDSFDGLTIEYAKKTGSDILIRGLRAVSDFEYEMQLSQTNNALAPSVTTVFLITKPKYNFISSSTVKRNSKIWGRYFKICSRKCGKIF